MLLYWIITKTLPEEHVHFSPERDEAVSQPMIVQCWVLGDKYDVVAFQDLIMVELLYVSNGPSIKVRAACEAFENSRTGSKLRLLVSRLIVAEVYWYESRYLEGFKELESVAGYFAEITNALHDMHMQEWAPITMMQNVRKSLAKGGFGEYLVGEGSNQHWVHKPEGKSL